VARYVDGFVLPIPKKNVAAYRRMARQAGKIWREHGALEYRECIADDVKPGRYTSFPPRLAGMMDAKRMPFDAKRMIYGGFEVVVDL
jgi:uncharacterized protein YbaA (DUF1428 family)